MDRLLDEIIAFCLCLPILGWAYGGWSSIVALLVAGIAVTTFELVDAGLQRAAVAGAFAIACALFDALFPFVPLAAYLCMAQRNWLVRCLWPASWLIVALRVEIAFALVALVVCCIASVLAVRTTRTIEGTRALRESRDAVKESLIWLLEREGPADTTPRDVTEEARTGTREGTGKDADATAVATPDERERLLRFSDLTERENTVVSLIAEGCENKEIAARLYLSEGTVRNVVSSILAKKQLANRTQIAIMYYRG